MPISMRLGIIPMPWPNGGPKGDLDRDPRAHLRLPRDRDLDPDRPDLERDLRPEPLRDLERPRSRERERPRLQEGSVCIVMIM